MNEYQALSRTPLVLELNRVQRLYTGGSLLDRWQGLPPQGDGVNSEEFLVSTVEYIGFGHPVENGLSRTRLPGGGYITLRALIQSDPDAFLGAAYSGLCHGHSGVLTRVGDSNVRLVIQCHPDREKAQRCFGVPFGKAEAWVIADTRVIGGVAPHLYCGFRPGVTREHWKELFLRQDVDGMLACMHRFEIRQGDTILIPAGMPHAMGSGCLFIEIHEPCDYTIRPERRYLTRELSDEEMHYGLGFDALLDFFDYTTYTEDEIRQVCFPQAIQEASGSSFTLTSLLRYENTPRFSIRRLELRGRAALPHFDGHFLLITEHGGVRLFWEGGSCDVPQGRGTFVPAGVCSLEAQGDASLLIAYPFDPAQPN